MDRCSLALRTGLQVAFAGRTAIQGEQKRAARKNAALVPSIFFDSDVRTHNGLDLGAFVDSIRLR